MRPVSTSGSLSSSLISTLQGCVGTSKPDACCNTQETFAAADPAGREGNVAVAVVERVTGVAAVASLAAVVSLTAVGFLTAVGSLTAVASVAIATAGADVTPPAS